LKHPRAITLWGDTRENIIVKAIQFHHSPVLINSTGRMPRLSVELKSLGGLQIK
jgi:hypothetical protein